MELAQVIINRPTNKLHKPLSYQVPSHFGRIAPGTRVLVPLGASREEGIVIGYETLDTPSFQVKPIFNVLDTTPWFTQEMMDTAKKIATYFLCSYGDALRLFTIRKRLKSYEPPKEEWLVVAPHFDVEKIPLRRKRQRELGVYLQAVTEAPVSLLKAKGYSALVINQMKDYDGISVENRWKDTKTSFAQCVYNEATVPLTDEQKQVFAPIAKALEEQRYEPFLLHGVTGSGKTQIYLRATAQCIQQGKVAIILVPEIILTDQIVRRFVETFGDEVVVFHSKITVSERNNNWERLRRKDSHIIIGARSAVFAPVDDIGLIVLDEEHDHSYKQEDMTLYHGRNIALWRAQAHQCPVILGSATPAIASYYKALQGTYTLLTLRERVHHQPMPKVLVVDMKEEMLHGNFSVFSDAMVRLIEHTLIHKEQMILLLNRRGYSTFVMCRTCGETIMCPNCDISLVYHRNDERLRCHYCEHSEEVPHVCPSCGSKKIKYFGSGTQKVEEELRKRFPGARIARLDQDVARKKDSGHDVLHAFREGQFDILLGTQMVSKGHDFHNVTAVGVITADSVLNIPVFTAAERTFDLLTQTSGRAGRGDKPGYVVIQTYNPLHCAIIKSKAHDYVGFYKDEIQNRKVLQYPPFSEMLQITVSQKTMEQAEQWATRITDTLLSVDDKVQVLGPYELPVTKVRNLYRMGIMLRGQDLRKMKEYISTSWIFEADGVRFDVDPE